MVSDTIQDALNAQINRELYSAYAYQALSAQAEEAGLKGVANWFAVQMQEELQHAKKIYAFLLSRQGHVQLGTIEAPPQKFECPLEMFECALEQECALSLKIGELMTLARKEGDHATEILMQWFVTEQVEEEDTARDIVDKLKLAGARGEGLYLVDQELALRKPEAQGA